MSIIIPTRHRAAALKACIDSLRKQTWANRIKEVLVVDDGPSADTEAVAREFGGNGKKPHHPHPPVIYLSQAALGANAARNRGIDQSSGDIVCFVDDDAVAPETWLERLVTGLLCSGAEVAAGAIRLPREGPILGKHREEVRALFAEVLEPVHAEDGRVVPVTCNMAAFRQTFDRARFDEIMRPPLEEVDWLMRSGASSVFVGDAWVWHMKSDKELRLRPALRLAWRRGSEAGWWSRVRLARPGTQRLREATMSARTVVFSMGHAVLRRCWGGLLTATSEGARCLSVLGLINRGTREASSWR